MMEKRDLVLLAHLRKNARATLTEIGKEMDMPVSTIFERLKGPLSSYIKKHTCILDNNKLGFTSRATLILKVDKEQKKEMGQFLNKHHNVNSLFRINNGYDFLLDVIFRQMIDLEEFIEMLESKYKLKHKEVYFVIDEMKQEGFLADPQMVQFVAEQPQPKAAKEVKSKQQH